MPFQENVNELCTVCCYRPQRWCFTCIFSFYFYFFHCFSLFCVFCFVFCSFLFWTFFNSYGTAENKYLKVPQIGERSHRVPNAAYTQVRCHMCYECGCDLGTQQHFSSAKKSTFLPNFFFLFYFLLCQKLYS